MYIEITVRIELQHSEGKFASREELAEQIIQVIEAADEGFYYGENEGSYETAGWSAEDTTPKKRPKS